MDALVEAIEAADGPWPVVAIAIIGLYLIIWRYGAKILDLLRENKSVAAVAAEKANQIADSIQTNHGSESLGDAVDRLTEGVQQLVARERKFTVELAALTEGFNNHLVDDDRRHLKVMALIEETRR